MLGPTSLRPAIRSAIRGLCLLVALGLGSLPAVAWTRPGHMVTAAIAYDQLRATDPKIIDEIIRIIADHPDPGPFQVAIGREEGEAKTRAIFLEIARWADDVRTGPDDHPTWHIALEAFDPAHSEANQRAVRGAAVEAFALNLNVARDAKASPRERAVALCWLFHILGDMHQPLHSSELFSNIWPEGNAGGAYAFVIDPETRKPVTLHWFWDDAVHRLAAPEAAFARAAALERKYPAKSFGDAIDGKAAHSPMTWLAESRAIARTLAYRGDAPAATSAEQATLPDAAYARDVSSAAERRVTLAGYRLAALLRLIF